MYYGLREIKNLTKKKKKYIIIIIILPVDIEYKV